MKYTVTVPVFATARIVIEASSAEEALCIAKAELYPCVCDECNEDIELGDPDFESRLVSIEMNQ